MQVELIEPEVAPGSEATGSDLVTLPPPKRAALALNTEKTEAALRGAVEKHKGITEIKDKAGRDQCHGAAMELMRLRTGLGATAKEVREDAVKFSKAVTTEEARLVAIVEPEEKRLKALRDAWDVADKARKEEEARIERERKQAIADRIARIKAYRDLAKECRTSTMVQGLIDKFTAAWDDWNKDAEALFAEFADDAGVAYRITLQHMQATLKEKADAEAEAERQRLERERLAEQQRQQEAEAARLAAEREAFERERAAFLAQQQSSQPAPAPAEPAAVETKVDLGEADEPTSTFADAKQHPIFTGGDVRWGKRRESVPDPFAAAEPAASAPAPQSPQVEDSNAVEAAVSAGFDAAMSAPLPERTAPANDAPPAESIVKVIAEAYGVPRATAIEWLVIRADDIFNLDDGEAA